jgi:hypothetical protein
MDTTAEHGTGAGGSPGVEELGAARVFSSDVVMTLALLNEGRYLLLRRYFGVSRDQANLLTAVIVFAGADVAYATTRHALHAPLDVSGADVTLGGLVVREAAYGVFGPGARGVPFFGGLVAAGLVGSLALPGVRAAIHRLRRTEHRIREQRLRVYNAGRSVER